MLPALLGLGLLAGCSTLPAQETAPAPIAPEAALAETAVPECEAPQCPDAIFEAGCPILELDLYVDDELRLGGESLGPLAPADAGWRDERNLVLYDHLLERVEASKCLGDCCVPSSAFLTIHAHPDVPPERLAPLTYLATQALFWVRWAPWHPA